MLVLTRKLMEKLYIGNDVCVTVVRLEGGQVRLGIEAPREIAVVRAELIDNRPAEAPLIVPEWPAAVTPPLAPIAPVPPLVPLAGAPPVRIRSGATREIGIRHREPSR